MGENPNSQPPPSSFWERPRRPPTSVTIPSGGLAGGVASHSPSSAAASDLPTPTYWPFTPLPDPSPIGTDESLVIPEQSPWPFTPCYSESGSFVEETPGIWEAEAERGVKKGEMEVGAVPKAWEDEDGSEADNLREIARLQGWKGSMSLATLQILKILVPLYFQPPFVRSFLLLHVLKFTGIL